MESKIEFTEQQAQKMAQYIKSHYGKVGFSLLVDPHKVVQPTDSRIGGLPYWDFAHPYPTNDQNQPLRFLCQINLQDLQIPEEFKISSSQAILPTDQNSAPPSIDKEYSAELIATMPQLPASGLLQFFALHVWDCFGCTFDINNPNCCVAYTPINTADSSLTMSQLRERLLEHGLDEKWVGNLLDDKLVDWPISGECALQLKFGIDLPHIGDFDFYNRVIKDAAEKVCGIKAATPHDVQSNCDDDQDSDCDNPYKNGDYAVMDAWDNYYELLEGYGLNLTEEEHKRCLGSFLGYPDFTQDNPLECQFAEHHFDTLLLRLEDQDDPLNKGFFMMWGDCGIANFFINSEKLKALDFSDVFYMWDCC